MLFFFADLNAKLNEVLEVLKHLMNRKNENGLQQCFHKAGVKWNHFDRKQITYKMIEEAINDFKAGYPMTFQFKQISCIL
jgi:hypothetical protein